MGIILEYVASPREELTEETHARTRCPQASGATGNEDSNASRTSFLRFFFQFLSEGGFMVKKTWPATVPGFRHHRGLALLTHFGSGKSSREL